MIKKLLKNEELVVAFYWLLVISVFWLQSAPQTSSLLEASLFCISLTAMIYLPCTYLSKVLLLRAMKEKKIKRFIYQFIICSLITGFLFAINIYSFYSLEKIGLFQKSDYFDLDELPIYILFVPLSAGIILNICICGIRFCIEYIKLQKITLNYQLQALQNQVNPHFMFNVLNHIYILMQKDVELSSELLVRYSEVLRYQLYNGKKDFVPLGQEIQFLQDVIEVEKMRWGKELNVKCHWDIENKETPIRPLILIAFIENAFKHVSRSISESGYIKISVRQHSDSLYMEVENSKSQHTSQKSESSGLGLKNTKELLEILYPSKHSLSIKENLSVYIIQLNITL